MAEIETLSQARAVLKRTFMMTAGDLAAMDQGASAQSIADLALQITTLQAGIATLDRALSVTAAETGRENERIVPDEG